MATATRPLRLDTIELSDNPLDYYPDEGLLKAFEIAVALGKPLLLSGEPGTGKTKFAHWAARKLSIQTDGQPGAFLPDPFIFPVKSTSLAGDLFYHYDAIGHFRSGAQKAAQYIRLEALGQAIAHAFDEGSKDLDTLVDIGNLKRAGRDSAYVPQARSSVILIDEADKAPREFPNDLLHEIENYAFRIPELACGLSRPRKGPCRIVTIITSNSEKNLPNAFLRRCVFYNINFPADKLLEIAKLKLQLGNAEYDAAINKAITEFMKLRDAATNKKPTTSEFLDWLGVLQSNGLLKGGKFPPDGSNAEDSAIYQASMSTLLKTTDDLRSVA
jgi:MoxR-like ATPase